jgi:hypothetical protein
LVLNHTAHSPPSALFQWLLFLDDDVVVDSRLLLEYGAAIRAKPHARGFVGMSRLPSDGRVWTDAIHCTATFFWHVAEWAAGNGTTVPWGVTANLVLLWDPALTFDTRFSRTGGGEVGEEGTCTSAHTSTQSHTRSCTHTHAHTCTRTDTHACPPCSGTCPSRFDLCKRAPPLCLHPPTHANPAQDVDVCIQAGGSLEPVPSALVEHPWRPTMLSMWVRLYQWAVGDGFLVDK